MSTTHKNIATNRQLKEIRQQKQINQQIVELTFEEMETISGGLNRSSAMPYND